MKSPEINNAIKWVDALCEQHHITRHFFASIPADKALQLLSKRQANKDAGRFLKKAPQKL